MSNEYDTENFGTLHKARSNLIDMLEAQGYNIDEYSGFKTSELHAMIKNEQLDMLLENKTNNKTYVKYFEICSQKPKLLNKKVMDEMVEDLFTLEQILTSNDTLIIISNTDPNDTLKTHMKYIWDASEYHVVVINIKSLLFNILNHVYVPNHRILSKLEDKQFRDKYNIKNDECIPEISRFDPVVKIIGLKPNQICEILRPSKNAIESYYYRICKNK